MLPDKRHKRNPHFGGDKKSDMTLSEYFEETGRKKSEFADAIGVERTWLYRIMNGRDCSSDVAKKIMEETGGKVTPNDLFLPAA